MPEDPVISRYIMDFERRWELYRRQQHHDFHHDFVTHFFNEHIVLGEKGAFESMLRGILTGPERDRLSTDQTLTRAWQIFVDLCWVKKKIKRGFLIFGAIVGVMLLALLAFLALPYVVGPKVR